jgi:hypothetical protein|tara:strand:+ start:110 stop:688 length:579 start_codon:yes stop_codon:yes gene_type:complete
MYKRILTGIAAIAVLASGPLTTNAYAEQSRHEEGRDFQRNGPMSRMHHQGIRYDGGSIDGRVWQGWGMNRQSHRRNLTETLTELKEYLPDNEEFQGKIDSMLTSYEQRGQMRQWSGRQRGRMSERIWQWQWPGTNNAGRGWSPQRRGYFRCDQQEPGEALERIQQYKEGLQERLERVEQREERLKQKIEEQE